MFERVNLLTAFLAGLLSFFSPCALPLVPLYLGHLAGAAGGAMPAGRPARVRLMGNAVAFVVGFSTIFVLLFGLPAGMVALQFQGQRTLLLRLGGLFLILLGLNSLGFLPLPVLRGGWRASWRPDPTRTGRWPTSFLVGVFFGLGWTPCIGAILGAITVLAVTGTDVGGAVALLTAYSFGLGLPFLGLAAGFDRAMPLLRRLRPHLPALGRLSGAFIVLVGLAMLFGAYQGFFVRLVRLLPWTALL